MRILRQIVASEYILAWYELNIPITVTCMKFNSLNNPIHWAIKRGLSAMSKNDGTFYIEPNPSSRDQEYFDEFRFDNIDEAIDTFHKFHKSN